MSVKVLAIAIIHWIYCSYLPEKLEFDGPLKRLVGWSKVVDLLFLPR